MTAVFLKILNMGITASWLILAICILRSLLRKMPKWITCILWALAAVRLLCPFTIESALSLVPHNEPLSEMLMAPPSFPSNHTLPMHHTASGEDSPENHSVDQSSAYENFEASAAARTTMKKDVWSLLSLIWIAGISVMAIYSLASYLRLYQITRISMPLYENILLCDNIDVPFILGILRPHIYLPSDLENSYSKYVIAHEKAHIARLDHWWKFAGFFILSIYWFHPLCWISYILFCRDLETACDEHVVKTFHVNDKKRYAEALLAYGGKHKTIISCPLSFGEIGTEERIRNILHYKKPALWIILGSLSICIFTAACFLTDPAGTSPKNTDTTDTNANTRSKPPAKDDNDVTKTSPEEQVARLQHMLERWTKAFVDRDGETIASVASAGLITDLKEAELLMGHKGSYSFGISSPWPQDYRTDRIIKNYDDSQAEIYYYARTSEPHITVWKETLDYQWDGTRYLATGETLSVYDSISSGAEFKEAYPFLLDGSIMDYTQNNLGESLQEHAVLSSSKVYLPLFSPESAAIQLLNLSPEDVKITRTGENTPTMIGLNLTFPSDHITAAISMVRPYGESGIWVPADYKMDVVYRFMNVDWNAVEKLPFTGYGFTDTLKQILCIGELPEHDIKVYGYNDDEVSCYGVAIDIKGDVNYFDWVYTSPMGILPQLYWDEKRSQLQIAFHIYTGTGASADSFYVLQRYDTGTLKPYCFDFDGYRAELEKQIGYTFHEKSKVLTLIDLKTKKELVSAELPDGNVTGIELGMISEFQLGDAITYRVTPGYLVDGGAMAQYDQMPTLEFDVTLNIDENDDISFRLENARKK